MQQVHAITDQGQNTLLMATLSPLQVPKQQNVGASTSLELATQGVALYQDVYISL